MNEQERAYLKDEIVRFSNSQVEFKTGKHFIKDKPITVAQFRELVEEISSDGYIKFLPYRYGSHSEDDVQVELDDANKGEQFLKTGGYSAKLKKQQQKKAKKKVVRLGLQENMFSFLLLYQR